MVSLTAVRDGLGRSLFGLIAGPDGPANRARIHEAPGPRWFSPDRPIRRVHGDASMFVGGLRALLLQSLHPLAMAGVAQHSDYRGDPWGRLQRTSTFLAVTTYGTATDAQRAVDQVRGIHRRVHGTTADGIPYAASDPHLLEWVHIAEIDSFLLAHQRYGAKPLDQHGRDGYVADAARIASALGVENPPTTEAELAQRIQSYRPELRGTREARDAARFLLLTPPLPLVARGPYAALSAAAVGMLPPWARLPLRLPYFPPAEATAVKWTGQTLVGGIRWAMNAR
ncbi:oxygenase MpaB family protein [Mycolicibacterium mengxianglii]|uniref:oxygenase MpaB family protein n=1 Tax=Mycolicibacterium mengxianglii TaxID=2736649 RepID=UPI0018D09ABA|nr:oxygenase MpaB family protein [Mycolicibacterium mengxianglii]